MQLLAIPHREPLLATLWAFTPEVGVPSFHNLGSCVFLKEQLVQMPPFFSENFLGLFMQVLQCLGPISHFVVSEGRIQDHFLLIPLQVQGQLKCQ